MLDALYAHLNTTAPVAVIIISVALMLLGGFLMTRITKLLHLPNVTAYITVGILIGPWCLDLIPRRVIDGTAFLPDIALAFIAFSTGEFFRVESLRRSGWGVIFLTLSESLLASLLVFAAVLLVKQHVWPDIVGGVAMAELGQLLRRLFRADRLLAKTDRSPRSHS